MSSKRSGLATGEKRGIGVEKEESLDRKERKRDGAGHDGELLKHHVP